MKPSDLSIGIRELLAVLVPGAVFLILFPLNLVQWLASRFASAGKAPDAAFLTLAFIVAAMAVGTLLSGLASLADDTVDKVMEDRIAHARDGRGGDRKLSKLAHLQTLAGRLEHQLLPGLVATRDGDRPWSVRSFWWNYLRLHCPVAIAELDRVEGVQKQFRSLWVVLLLPALLALLSVATRWLGYAAPSTSSDARDALMIVSYGLGALLCWTSYVTHRIRFSRRLYEMAIISEHARCGGIDWSPAPWGTDPGDVAPAPDHR